MRFVACVGMSLIVAAPLVAQSKPQTREGFTIGFGVGLGSAGVSCSNCGTERKNAGSGYLRIGGAVRPNLIVAGESQAWAKSESDQGTTDDVTIAALLAVVLWYPEPQDGFHLKGGLGFGSITDDIRDPLFSAKLESTGVAFTFGVGYDWRLGKNFSLTPYLSYFATTGAEAKVNGSSLNEKLNANLFQVGLGFTWH
jgi:hypothetical protein